MLDLRLTNATFHTMDPTHPVAGQVGIWGGRIVGVDEAVAGLPARREVDLGGATVLPGFVDAHVHLAWAGLRAGSASVAPCARVDDVLAAIAAAAGDVGVGEWLDVVGYDQRPLGRHLTAAELDRVAPGRKVFVVHDSGHACVVSTSVLVGLPPDVSHDNGFLAEGGMAAVRALRQPYSLDELVAAIIRAARTCLAEGVTTVAEAGIGGGLVSHSPVELAAYQRARLPVRVRLMIAAAMLRDLGAHPGDGLPRAMDLGLHTGFGGDRLGVGALKVFTDGGMMARTAALTAPYAGSDHSGQLYDDPDRLRAVVVDAHRGGWQLAVHAIGDRAVDLALDAFTLAQRDFPRSGTRHRIEHAGLVRPDQLPRFAELGVSAVVQPNFLYYLGDDYADVMGPDRADWLYRGKGFLDHGVPLVGSSDRPVTDGAPLRSIQFMVTRRTSTGRVVGPAEAITVPEALRAFTTAAARACLVEDSVGSITAGKLADLVVLGADPHTVDPAAIGDIEVRATAVGGEIVHGTPLW
ncbi:amidohydrolase [Actinokineospora sp. NBRC 105648]|uniref:amidohydrolase n=1 Tax=Actinokineospora sp. NBRC 105648 TaxID=3032206 RepID=UPI00249FC234|nr:amidohydrolase [Actinokineospora sp. NBRC 105648]GLZ38881.1 amidohydrolase [Actinokineospora sp. NBRC 105648]